MTAKVRGVLLLSGFALLAAPGCSKNNPNAPASITGKVTYNGVAVGAGTITFHINQGTFTSSLGPDGSFSITEMPVGEAKVSVETETANSTGYTDPYQSYGGPKSKDVNVGPSAPRPVDKPSSYVKIPKRYANPDESKLTVTLSKGTTKRDFQLTD